MSEAVQVQQVHVMIERHLSKLVLASTLIAALNSILARPVAGQSFTTLHDFTGSDGAYPYASLLLSGSTLYGTAELGGSSDVGVVFKVNTDGTGFTNLHVFTRTDGAYPIAGLVLSGNNLFGMTQYGGAFDNGIVYRLSTDGTDFTNLYSFTVTSGPLSTNSDGSGLSAGLVVSDNTLYGMANRGGSSGAGTIFALNTDGTGFTNLHSFSAGPGSFPHNTNTDGAYPNACLLVSGKSLYGTASYGGCAGNGTVFRIGVDGTGFTTLHNFTAAYIDASYYYTNSDGADPRATLILAGNFLYGTTYEGGNSGFGSIFKLNTNGTGFTRIYSFTVPYKTNRDGAAPSGGLRLSGNALYGTAFYGGGADNDGVVFKINTDGTGFATLHDFTALDGDYLTNSDGANPANGVVLAGSALYGAGFEGGSAGKGTVFRLDLSTPLFFSRIGDHLVLAWTNMDFHLQSAPAVTGTYTNLPNVSSPYTNPLTSMQQFFRLLRP